MPRDATVKFIEIQWKDLHAMLPNSTTLYDGCASGIVGVQWRDGFGACDKTLDATRTM